MAQSNVTPLAAANDFVIYGKIVTQQRWASRIGRVFNTAENFVIPMLRHYLLPLLAVFLGTQAMAANSSPFEDFLGRYSTGGEVIVSDDSGTPIPGTVSMRFTAGSGGKRANLKISGRLRVGDALVRYSTTVTLRRNGKRADITDLAPGFNDQRHGQGTYSMSRRRISIKFPIEFESVTGTELLTITLIPHPSGTRLSVVQKLDTTELESPITWKYLAGRAN
jgi:hypothetical protein